MIIINGDWVRIRKGAGVANLKVPSFHSPREGTCGKIFKMALRIWKVSTNVSEVNYASIYGELFSP